MKVLFIEVQKKDSKCINILRNCRKSFNGILGL